MTFEKKLYVVHCIDTEGPMRENLADTFQRIKDVFGLEIEATQENLVKLQNQELKIDRDKTVPVSKFLNPKLLRYKRSWEEIDEMLDECLGEKFRNQYKDDFGNGWVYSWHCVDHIGYEDNPRHKDIGYGNILRHYKQKLKETSSNRDEINWHYHPLSPRKNILQCATNYFNSYSQLSRILCRRIIEDNYFPTVNRAGFHTERQDIHQFLENWIPYDFSNQSYEQSAEGQADLENGRFGDWRRAPFEWIGYNPSHNDYQQPGQCNRWIFRCLNVGTRFKQLKVNHIKQAFLDSEKYGSAILAFTNHDYREIRDDVTEVMKLINETKKSFPGVSIEYSGANHAARNHIKHFNKNIDTTPIELSIQIIDSLVTVKVEKGSVFGSQPYLAIKTKENKYFHDNFDIQIPGKLYTYTLDCHTFYKNELVCVGVGTSSLNGSYDVKKIFV